MSSPIRDERLPAPSVPSIALVTTVLNSVARTERTIQSVLSQNYPNLEYFIVDGGSTDGALDIIRKYRSQISGWLSEPDRGMYDAINKGFARTTGDVMGWISATDVLQPGALHTVAAVFTQFPQVEWITGRRTALSEAGEVLRVNPLLVWSRRRFVAQKWRGFRTLGPLFSPRSALFCQCPHRRFSLPPGLRWPPRYGRLRTTSRGICGGRVESDTFTYLAEAVPLRQPGCRSYPENTGMVEEPHEIRPLPAGPGLAAGHRVSRGRVAYP
jgi:hypothetical protein